MTTPPQGRDGQSTSQRWIDEWWAKERAARITSEADLPSAPEPPAGESAREAVERITESMIARRALPLVPDESDDSDDAPSGPAPRRGLPPVDDEAETKSARQLAREARAERRTGAAPPVSPAVPMPQPLLPASGVSARTTLPRSPVTPKSRPTPPPAPVTPPPAATVPPPAKPPSKPAKVSEQPAATPKVPAPTPDSGLKPTRGRQRNAETVVAAEVLVRSRRRRRWGFGLIAILVLALAAGAGYLLSRPTSSLVSTKPLMLPATLAEYARDPNSGTSPSTHAGSDQKTTVSATYSRAGTSMFIVVASRPETDAVAALVSAGASEVRPVSGGACGSTVDQDRQACMVVRGGTAVMVLALQGQDAAELLRVASIAADTVS